MYNNSRSWATEEASEFRSRERYREYATKRTNVQRKTMYEGQMFRVNNVQEKSGVRGQNVQKVNGTRRGGEVKQMCDKSRWLYEKLFFGMANIINRRPREHRD